MKTKRGGRELNPTDAFRKQARKRENKRNKAERTYIRDAFGKAQNTDKLSELKAELEELIAEEQQSGELNRLQKLRKKVVLEAYEVAIRKKKVRRLLWITVEWARLHGAAAVAGHGAERGACSGSTLQPRSCRAQQGVGVGGGECCHHLVPPVHYAHTQEEELKKRQEAEEGTQ